MTARVSSMAMRLLLVEDNPGDARLVREMCREQGLSTDELTHVDTMSRAEAHLADHEVDLILLDLGLPDGRGLEVLRRAHAAAPRVPLVVLTGLDDESIAVQALQQGAQDYLIKGQLETRGLMRALHYAIERKVMEEALFAEKELAVVTLNSIGDGVISTDVSGTITLLNLVAETMTGWSNREATGRPIAEVFRVLDAMTRETVGDAMQTAIRNDRTEHLPSDRLLLRRDGSEIAIADTVSPIHDREGNVAGAVIVVRDVSEARELELRMRAVGDELERSNRELDDFAAIASHDLQEPLRKIQAFGDRLAEHSSSVIDEEARDYLRRMTDAACRMQILITDLLEYSQVTTRPEPPQPVDLGQVVTEVLSDLDEGIRSNHGSVIVGPLPTVSANPLQMRQLFQNLIANSLKFHPEGVAPEVHVDATARDDGGGAQERRHGLPLWVISVRDNGIGFDEKYAERIFAPFQRINGRQAFAGAGMGLAICRRIVTLRGGTITASSRPGAGATFVITLPGATLAAHAGGPAE
jgi:PAS domain S-box-containing protein